MDYFLIEQDKRCTNVPQLTDINTNIERRYINRQDEGKIQNEMVLYVKSSEWNNYQHQRVNLFISLKSPQPSF